MENPTTPAAARFALKLAARLVHGVTHLIGLDPDTAEHLEEISQKIKKFVNII
jgi:hypothetical protein